MKVSLVKFIPWDKAYWFEPAGLDLSCGDQVVVRTDVGMEVGQVTGFEDITEEQAREKQVKQIMRKATKADLEKTNIRQSQKDEALKKCRKTVKNLELYMKIIDVHFSFDGGRITFAFTADGRVDFRVLVKELTHTFQKSVRLHQLGVRDEAKHLGEYGTCGRCLCCKMFLGELGQVSGDYADLQQVAHRGSERLSGPCGRLKCCLRFEQKMYENMCSCLPKVGTKVRTDHGRGEIIEQNLLKQSVKVMLHDKDKTIVEIPIGKDKQEKSN